MLTFQGEPKDHHVHEHAHESGPVMSVPLILLAGLAIVSPASWCSSPSAQGDRPRAPASCEIANVLSDAHRRRSASTCRWRSSRPSWWWPAWPRAACHWAGAGERPRRPRAHSLPPPPLPQQVLHRRLLPVVHQQHRPRVRPLHRLLRPRRRQRHRRQRRRRGDGRLRLPAQAPADRQAAELRPGDGVGVVVIAIVGFSVKG